MGAITLKFQFLFLLNIKEADRTEQECTDQSETTFLRRPPTCPDVAGRSGASGTPGDDGGDAGEGGKNPATLSQPTPPPGGMGTPVSKLH